MKAGAQSDWGTAWDAGAAPLPPPRPQLNYDLDVDVCVIGGGLAGLTAAREIARRGWSVVVLEARRIAWNASGRNSGVVLPGFPAPLENIVERIGLSAAKELWELSRSGADYIRKAAAEMSEAGVDGVIEGGDGWLGVSKWPGPDRMRARAGLLKEMGESVEVWRTDQVREALRTRHYFDGLHVPGAFQINPLVYALGLAAAAVQAGARIFENTPVTAADLAGIRKRIQTPRARVRADHVVLAGNVHLGGIVRSLADTLIPVTAWTGVTQPLGKALAEAIAFGGAVSQSRDGWRHYRIAGGDRLLWTGSAPGGLLARRALAREIGAAFPRLGPVRFERFWPAQAGFTVHRMPQIGAAERGVWIASGFGGHGLNTTAMAGELIARGIAERDDEWKRFLPFDLVWAGGLTGRAVALAIAGWRRGSDAACAFAARQHEEHQRRQREKKKADGKPTTKIAALKLFRDR